MINQDLITILIYNAEGANVTSFISVVDNNTVIFLVFFLQFSALKINYFYAKMVQK